MNKEEVYWLELNKIKAEQLMSYFTEVEQTGWYYGNKRCFEKRHKEMKNCLSNMLKNFNNLI